jgi:phage gp29-like protein
VDRLGSKPLEWFHYDQTRGWVFRQDGGLDGLAIDPRKFLITVRGGSLRQPYGEPLLSRLWFPVTWRLEGWSHWLHYLEAFGMPMVLGQVVDYQGFVDAMAAQGVRTAVGWQAHPDDRVTTIHASGAGEFERLERALTTRIQRLILGQTLTSDVGDSGSYAAAKVHNDVRDDKRLADLRMVSGTVQQLADALCELNGWGAAPRVVFADDTGLEVQRAERDKTLQDALAASGLRLTLNYYTDRYDLGDEDLEPAPDASRPPDSEPPGDDRGDAGMAAVPPHQFRPAQRFTPVQQAIEDEVERLAPDLEWPVSVEAIRAAIRGARDQADLEERLAAVLGAADDPRLADLLARAQFAAMVLGYVAAEERRT